MEFFSWRRFNPGRDLRQPQGIRGAVRAGREIASVNELGKRITYLAADFLQDDLPAGFDMVMLCDVGATSEDLFRRIHEVLNFAGRLVIVEKFAPSRTTPPPSRLPSGFIDSLIHPAQSSDLTTAQEVQALLERAGFGDFALTAMPHDDDLPWNMDWSVLEARKKMEGV